MGARSSKIESTQSESAVVITDAGDLVITGITPWNPPPIPALAVVVVVVSMDAAKSSRLPPARRVGIGGDRLVFELGNDVDLLLSDWRSNSRSGCQGSLSSRLTMTMSSSSSSNALDEELRCRERF